MSHYEAAARILADLPRLLSRRAMTTAPPTRSAPGREIMQRAAP